MFPHYQHQSIHNIFQSHQWFFEKLRGAATLYRFKGKPLVIVILVLSYSITGIKLSILLLALSYYDASVEGFSLF